jgi:thioredoxin 1
MTGACEPGSATSPPSVESDSGSLDVTGLTREAAGVTAGTSTVQAIQGGQFEQQVLRSELPVVVDFHATWCAPCRRLTPILDRLAEEFAGQIRFVKIDSDEESGLAERFQVNSLPTVIFFKDGQIVGQFAGLPQEDALRNELNRWVASGIH